MNRKGRLAFVAAVFWGALVDARGLERLEIACEDAGLCAAVARSSSQQFPGSVVVVDASVEPANGAWRLSIAVEDGGHATMHIRDSAGRKVVRTLAIGAGAGELDRSEALALEIPSMIERIRALEKEEEVARVASPVVAEARAMPVPVVAESAPAFEWGPAPDPSPQRRSLRILGSVYSGVWTSPGNHSATGGSATADLLFAHAPVVRIGVGVYPFELDATDLFPYLRFSALDTLLGISLERGRLMGSVFAGGSLIVGQAPGQLDLLTAYSADTTIGWRLDSRFEIRTRVTGTYASGSAQSTGNHAGQFRFPHLFVVGSLGLATEF